MDSPIASRRPTRAALLLTALAAIGLGACNPPYMNNRNPESRHGNIEQPGSHAAENQGEAGQRP